MDEWVILSVGFVLLIVTFISGVPLFVAFLLVNGIGVALLMGAPGFGLMANSIFDTVNIDALAALPLFILMGDFLYRGGAIENLMRSTDKLIGRVPGRQYVLTSLLSIIFGALSGSAMAISALMARSIFPSMITAGYNRKLSIGVILGGASLAPIIPPSVAVILIATLANVSIGKLLMAGVGPGLLLGGLFIGYTVIRTILDPKLSPATETVARRKPREVLLALLHLLPTSLIIFSVIGFILFGIATPTESAATGTMGAIVSAALYRKLTWKMVSEAFYSTAMITSTILVIMASSNMFGQLLAFSGLATQITAFVGGLDVPIALVVFMLMAVTFVFCVFADEIAMMLILVPLFKPIVLNLGVDEIWFWTLLLINLVLGGITPPFGYTMYAFRSGAPNTTLGEIYNAAWPFVGLFVFAMALFSIFPKIVTYIPSQI